MCAEFYSIKLIFGEMVLHQIQCSIFANEPLKIGYVTSQKIQKGGCILLTRKPRSIPVITLTLCYQSCWRIVMILMGDNFIFQQDGVPAHAARLMQQWLSDSEHCPDFIDKDSWPPNRPDLNPLESRLPRVGSAGEVQ